MLDYYQSRRLDDIDEHENFNFMPYGAKIREMEMIVTQ